jgi:hypothetical protein
VSDTGRLATVYNLEIEDDHTYFVGCDEWGFSVWAHNRDGCGGTNRYARQMQDKSRQVERTAGQAQREARLRRGNLADEAEAQILRHEELIDSPATLVIKQPSRLVDSTLSQAEQAHRQLHLRIKVSKLQDAAEAGTLRYSPGTASVRDASLQSAYRQRVIERYRRIFRQDPPQMRLRDADHPVEMVLGHPADQPLKMLDSHINRSVGPSLENAASRLEHGRAIGRIIVAPGS